MVDKQFLRMLGQLEGQQNLPMGVLRATLQTESGGNPNAVSPVGAQGLFQFMPKTAAQYGIDPRDPNQSARAAALMQGDLYQKYGGDLSKTLAAWNWGQGNVDQKGMAQRPAETVNFDKKVQKTMGQEPSPSLGASFSPQAPQPIAPTLDYQSLLGGIEGREDQALQQYLTTSAEAEKKISDIEGTIPEGAQKVEIPQYKPRPMVDPQEYQEFSSAMMVMAALGGAMSGGRGYGWVATTDALNSAIQGFTQGNMERYQKGIDDYNRLYQEALKQQEIYNTEFRNALEAKGLSIREQMAKIENASRSFGNIEASMNAKRNDIFKLIEMQTKQQEATERLKLQHERMKMMMSEKALDRENKLQQIHEKAAQLKDLPTAAIGKLTAMNQSVIGLNSVINEATADPELLKATFKVPWWKDSEQFQMAMKSGQLTFMMTPEKSDLQSDEEYYKQVDFWRHVATIVERYAVATSPSRSFGVLQFFQQIKPQSSDAPALAMMGFKRFRDESKEALKQWADGYAKNPAHRGQMDVFLEGTGVEIDSGAHQSAGPTGGEKIVDFRSLK